MKTRLINRFVGIIWDSYVMIKKTDDSLSHTEILKRVKKNRYPYSNRHNHYYKIWLQACKVVNEKIDNGNV